MAGGLPGNREPGKPDLGNGSGGSMGNNRSLKPVAGVPGWNALDLGFAFPDLGWVRQWQAHRYGARKRQARYVLQKQDAKEQRKMRKTASGLFPALRCGCGESDGQS